MDRSSEVIEQIREINLSYIMLAQRILREDRAVGMFRQGVSPPVATAWAPNTRTRTSTSCAGPRLNIALRPLSCAPTFLANESNCESADSSAALACTVTIITSAAMANRNRLIVDREGESGIIYFSSFLGRSSTITVIHQD